MADNALEIIILAKDQATGVLRGIGNTMSSVFSASKVVALGGLGAITGAVGLMMNEAMEAERVQAQLNAVLRSTGGVAGVTAEMANAIAGSLSNVTTFSDDAILSGENMLLTFTNIGKDVFPMATETMLNMASVFGSVDQAAIQLGKALNDPVQGAAALRRVGVNLTQEQQDMIKTLVEAGNLEEAQQIILRELSVEFGGVARAAGDTFAGKLTILKNRLLNVFETLGMALLPALTRLVDILLADVIPAVEELGEQALPYIEEGLVMIQNAFEDLKDIVVPFVQKHMKAFKAALIAIGVVLAGAAVVGGILLIVGALMAIIETLIIMGAVALVAFAWTEDLFGIKTFIVDRIWPPLKQVFDQIITTVRELWEDWRIYFAIGAEAARNMWTQLQPILETFAHYLMVVIATAFQIYYTFYKTLFLATWEALKLAWENVLKPVFDALVEFLEIAIPVAIELAKIAWDKLKEAWTSLEQMWKDTLKPAFEEIQAWLEVNLPIAGEAVKNALLGAWQNAMIGMTWLWNSVLKPALDILIQVFEASIPLAVGAAKASIDGMRYAFMALQWVWNNILKPAFEALQNFLEVVLPVAQGVAELAFAGIEQAFLNLQMLWESVLKPAFDLLKGYLDTTLPVAKDALVMAWDAIEKRFNNLVTVWNNTLKPAFNDVIHYCEISLKTAFDIINLSIDSFKSALNGAAWIWTNILKPALTEIISVLQGVFKTAVNNAEGAFNTFKSVISEVSGWISTFKGGIDSIISTFEGLNSVVTAMGEAIDKAASLVPDWLIPGSPTPFEMGIRGITSAIQDFDSSFAALSLTLDASPVAVGANGDNTNNFNLTINSNAQSENLKSDFEIMKTWGGL